MICGSWGILRKIKTSSPQPPYYSTEHTHSCNICSTSHSQSDLLRQQSEKFHFRVSGVAGDWFLMNFTSLIIFHYEWIFHPMFRFCPEPQTIKYHESEALALHVHSWTPKLIFKKLSERIWMFKVSQTYEIWTSKSPKVHLIQKLRLAHHRPRITLESI